MLYLTSMDFEGGDIVLNLSCIVSNCIKVSKLLNVLESFVKYVWLQVWESKWDNICKVKGCYAVCYLVKYSKFGKEEN